MTSISRQKKSRRAVLRAVAGGAALVALKPLRARAQRSNKGTFVLVHPAWHGAWCWKKVTPLLRAQGHEVHTPTLTGLGERAHLARPEIGLAIHVEDVVSILKYEDLRDVVLVGHSSSGMVITGVAGRAPEHIAHLVYLDAFVPGHGQSLLDLLPPDRRQAFEDFARSEGKGWLVPRFAPLPWDHIVRKLWGVNDAADVQWMLARLVPTPLAHFKEPAQLVNLARETLVRTYIRCLKFPHVGFDRHAAMARGTAGWRYRELPAPHHPAITHPREVAALLLEAV